jgi:methionyl aminopeptidase
MISLKSAKQLEVMREAGRIAANALKLAGKAIEPGVSTLELDKLIYDYIVGKGGSPSTLGYNGYPASSCISCNHVVIHGIPSGKLLLKNGDIVSIDIVASYGGYHGDTTATFAVGDISPQAKRLLEVTKECLYEGINAARAKNRLGDIGSAIQRYAESRGYSVVRKFTGHGIGAEMHESPEVLNYGTPGKGARLYPGMTLAIEPMINQGGYEVDILGDGWTVVTRDGKLAAHFEHTVAVTDSEPQILTLPD